MRPSASAGAACSTPIISDEWDGLDELLPEGRALLIARSTADVVEALTQTPEARRRSIGEAARQRILMHHTGSARARELVRLLHGLPEPERSSTGETDDEMKLTTAEEGAIG